MRYVKVGNSISADDRRNQMDEKKLSCRHLNPGDYFSLYVSLAVLPHVRY
jgi:hypothetical protein